MAVGTYFCMAVGTYLRAAFRLSPHGKCLHFVVVVGLEWLKDTKSYAGGSLLLVGSPLPDRSKVMAQTKRGTLVLQTGGWAAG